MTNHSDPFDELAALFLSDAHNQPMPENETNTIVELALIGHLPVRAGVWLTPYADIVARELGPTGLLRLDSDQPSLQLLRPTSEDFSDSSSASMQRAIGDAASQAAAWVVRPDSRTPASELVEARVDRITILSSADEAAVVAAYQLVKDLAEAAEHADRELPAVGLAILGADRHTADRMRQRLNRTTSTFLGIELPMVACISQIDSTARATQRLSFADDAAPDIVTALKWIEQATTTAAAAAESAPTDQRPTPLVEVGPDHDPEDDTPVIEAPSGHTPPVEPAVEPPVKPKVEPPVKPGVEPPVAAPGADELPIEQPPAAGSPPSVTPSTPSFASSGPAFEPKQPQRPREASGRTGAPVPLGEYVDGVSALPKVRCNGHEAVELGVDHAGRIHVMARETQMRSLHSVEGWARAHRELIAMASGDHYFDLTGDTVCHVFTEKPANVADLHTSDLRLHVLSPVMVDGRRGWYYAPLNAVV